MSVDTKEVVTTVAYMMGVRTSILENNYSECAELLERLKDDQNATVIRYLSKLRTALMLHFKKTDDEMHYNLKNLTSLEWYDKAEIRQLEKWGFQIIQANYRAEKYMQDFTRLINENIDKCSGLFYDWINWQYIRELFYVPKYNKDGVMKEEFAKYMENINEYPFQVYIRWNPSRSGSVIYSDRKFLQAIYSDHGELFSDYSKYRDADDEVRNNIYNFIDESVKTAIAVDCENSDPYKLYSVLKGLNQDELSKIEKITLYDDSNTTAGWDWLEKFISIPVEHNEIRRVVDRKSLVDIRMTAGVVADFYREGITSFIIVSSDSDFWGLIESLPNADFLIMYEYEKCGSAIKNALTEHGIYYCSIDDFCTAGTEELKKAVLFAELEKYFPTLIGRNPEEMVEEIYQNTKISATKKEMELFCNRYVKTLRLKLVKDRFVIEINR